MRLTVGVLFLLAACGDNGRGTLDGGAISDGATMDAVTAPDGGRMDSGPGQTDGGPVQDGGPLPDTTADTGRGPELCERRPGAANRTRTLVVSHPTSADLEAANVYRAIPVSAAGELQLPGETFEMGRATDGRIAFTADGEIGVSVQDYGTLGVFRVMGDGSVEVLHAALEVAFPVGRVVAHPDGNRFWVLGLAFEDAGGGIYELGVGCDGELVEIGLVAPGRLPWALASIDGEHAVVAAERMDDVEAYDAYLVGGDPLAVMAGADAFLNGSDNDAIPSAMDVTPDGRVAVIGENSVVAEYHRIAVVGIGESELRPLQLYGTADDCEGEAPPGPCINDPSGVVASPFGDMVLVSAADGENAIYRFDYDPEDAETPLSFVGEIAYTGGRPLLPTDLIPIEDGDLRGLVFVPEVGGIRRLRFEGDGLVTDLGVASLGDGIEVLIGAMGVSP